MSGGESRFINRTLNSIKTDIESVMNGDRLKTIGRDEYTFVAAALTSNVSNQVIVTPTTTTVQIVVKAHSIATAENTGTIDLESSSTDVGVAGVFSRMYATKYQVDHAADENVPLGVGQTLRVTSTVGGAAFIAINYIEE